MRHLIFTVVALIILITGCSLQPTILSPTSISTPVLDSSATTPPSIAPTVPATSALEWLREKPFQQAREEAPVMLDELPSGFIVAETHSQVMQLPSGAEAHVTTIRYDYTEDGQIVTERHVIITMVSYDSADNRMEHLDLLETQEYEWFYCDINRQQIACYRDPDVQGRVWDSGGYLVVAVGGPGQENSDALDAFTALYLNALPSE